MGEAKVTLRMVGHSIKNLNPELVVAYPHRIEIKPLTRRDAKRWWTQIEDRFIEFKLDLEDLPVA